MVIKKTTHKIIFCALSFFITHTTHGMIVPLDEVTTFLKQISTMTLESVRSSYDQLPSNTKKEIDLFLKTQENPELSEQLTLISTSENNLNNKIAHMCLPKKLKENNGYMQTTLPNLYSQEKEHVKSEVKTLETKFKNINNTNYNDNRFVLLRSDLVLLQRHFTLFPYTGIDLNARNNVREGPFCKYKAKRNWQGLKALLEMVAFEENRLFLLPEYVAFITPLMSFALQKYIKFNFCSQFISKEAVATNMNNKLFNETVKNINLQIAELNHSFPRLYLIDDVPERSLLSEIVFSNHDILKMKLHTLLHWIISIRGCTVYSRPQYKRKTSYFHLFAARTYPLMGIINTLLLLVDFLSSNQLFDDYFDNWQGVIKDVTTITALYGIVFSLIVLKNMYQEQHCQVVCTQKEIKKLLQRTDIEILN